MDLRIQVIEIPTQDVISRDNVSIKVDAVLFLQRRQSGTGHLRVQRYQSAMAMLAQTTLRAVPGRHELNEMLSERKKLSTDVQSILDAQTEAWGIKVSNVEIRTVDPGQHGACHRQTGGVRNATGAPRSSMLKLSSRPRRRLSTPPRSCRAFRPPRSGATCKP